MPLNSHRDQELQHLSMAEAHVAGAERAISQQVERVEKLRGRGHDTRLAEETLRTFEDHLQQMREHRDGIKRTIQEIDRGL